jgi:hypothetical protein
MPNCVCYACQKPTDRLIEVDDGVYVYLCSDPCEKLFWDVIVDLVGAKDA